MCIRDRDISISREITKKFETVYRGKLSDVIRNVPEKGEFVIVVSGCEAVSYTHLN